MISALDQTVAAGFEAIESQVAIVNSDGVTVYTNDAWDEFGRENGLEGATSIQADSRLLPHLFENLFRNSVEHGGPVVTVTVGPLNDGFYVADDGPGLPAGAIFETGVSMDGTGLGLTIVKAVADAHN